MERSWPKQTIALEGNQYSPPDSIKWEYLKPSDTHTVSWKGTASYKNVVVNGKGNADAA
jgi:uncharacterized protein (DUF427 family)